MKLNILLLTLAAVATIALAKDAPAVSPCTAAHLNILRKQLHATNGNKWERCQTMFYAQWCGICWLDSGCYARAAARGFTCRRRLRGDDSTNSFRRRLIGQGPYPKSGEIGKVQYQTDLLVVDERDFVDTVEKGIEMIEAVSDITFGEKANTFPQWARYLTSSHLVKGVYDYEARAWNVIAYRVQSVKCVVGLRYILQGVYYIFQDAIPKKKHFRQDYVVSKLEVTMNDHIHRVRKYCNKN